MRKKKAQDFLQGGLLSLAFTWDLLLKTTPASSKYSWNSGKRSCLGKNRRNFSKQKSFCIENLDEEEVEEDDGKFLVLDEYYCYCFRMYLRECAVSGDFWIRKHGRGVDTKVWCA